MEGQVATGSLNLVYRKEKSLFAISAIISILVWAALILGTLGIALIYLLFGYIFYLFVQSAFISYLRGTGVLITVEQFPDLFKRVSSCCDRLGIVDQPDAYLIHADGAFNALATRFLGRNFIVLFSNVVDALDEHPEAVNFYIGHELGHIHRKHLVWGPVLWPAGLLPLLGAAYSRAREYTCDSYGAACCDDPDSAINGIGALAAGDQRWRSMNMGAYSGQAGATGSFWMSFHELTGDYPWLTKRMSRLMHGDSYNPPGRSGLAWFLACFVPRFGVGGASLLITVAIIGILAAVAIPAYQDYTIRAQITEGLSLASAAKTAATEYYVTNGYACTTNEECGLAPAEEYSSANVESVTVGEGSVISVRFSTAAIAGETILLHPYLDDDERLQWDCTGGTLAAKFRPSSCRSQ